MGLSPETTHMFTWLFGDRGTPDGYRHMNGYSSKYSCIFISRLAPSLHSQNCEMYNLYYIEINSRLWEATNNPFRVAHIWSRD